MLQAVCICKAWTMHCITCFKMSSISCNQQVHCPCQRTLISVFRCLAIGVSGSLCARGPWLCGSSEYRPDLSTESTVSWGPAPARHLIGNPTGRRSACLLHLRSLLRRAMLLCGGRGPLPRVDLFDQLVGRQPRASDSSSSQSCVLQATIDSQLQPPSFAKRVPTLRTPAGSVGASSLAGAEPLVSLYQSLAVPSWPPRGASSRRMPMTSSLAWPLSTQTGAKCADLSCRAPYSSV